MKEPTFTPAATGAHSEANTTAQRDDEPSIEWIAAFKAQATEQMMDDVVAYVVKRASWIHHQKGDNAKSFVREMVVDVPATRSRARSRGSRRVARSRCTSRA